MPPSAVLPPLCLPKLFLFACHRAGELSLVPLQPFQIATSTSALLLGRFGLRLKPWWLRRRVCRCRLCCRPCFVRTFSKWCEGVSCEQSSLMPQRLVQLRC